MIYYLKYCFQPNAHVKANILLRLRMVSTLFSTLDTRLPTDDETAEGGVMPARNSAGDGDAPEVQPVQVILQWLLPVLKTVVERWASDEHIMTVNISLEFSLINITFHLELQETFMKRSSNKDM